MQARINCARPSLLISDFMIMLHAPNLLQPQFTTVHTHQ